nr:MAG TPA: hypothetical protein [Caudoviricetes sp.]
MLLILRQRIAGPAVPFVEIQHQPPVQFAQPPDQHTVRHRVSRKLPHLADCFPNLHKNLRSTHRLIFLLLPNICSNVKILTRGDVNGSLSQAVFLAAPRGHRGPGAPPPEGGAGTENTAIHTVHPGRPGSILRTRSGQSSQKGPLIWQCVSTAIFYKRRSGARRGGKGPVQTSLRRVAAAWGFAAGIHFLLHPAGLGLFGITVALLVNEVRSGGVLVHALFQDLGKHPLDLYRLTPLDLDPLAVHGHKNVVLILAVVLEQANRHHIIVGVMGKGGIPLLSSFYSRSGFRLGIRYDCSCLCPGLFQDLFCLGSSVRLWSRILHLFCGSLFFSHSQSSLLVWGRLPQRAAPVIYQEAPLKVEVVSMRTM